MRNVAREWPEGATAPKEYMQGAIPRYTHMLFQGMFFIITPALICGAFAERMKFSAMVLFMILWDTIVYCPLAHWVWGNGVLMFGQDGAWAGGALDFAGGTVVHISSGTSALICALLIGKRVGFGQEDMRPHNLTYTALGAAMLWVGWFGFNAGSELMSGLRLAHAWQADRARHRLRHRSRPGVHHACVRLCQPDARANHGRGGGRRVRVCLQQN
jgi:Amt family ammonium transporter